MADRKRDYKEEVKTATAELRTMTHVAALTGLRLNEVSEMLPKGKDSPKTMFDRVRAICAELRTRSQAAQNMDLESAGEHDTNYQARERIKAQTKKLKLEIEVLEGKHVALDDVQRDLAKVAQVAAKNLDGLLPKIQSLIKTLPAHVSDEIELVIADCRNAIADVKLTDPKRKK